jgi:pilus assembly protein CpaC
MRQVAYVFSLTRQFIVFAVLGISPILALAQPKVVNLYVGKVLVLNELNVKRVAVGNGKIVSVAVIDNKQVLVLPELAGQTEIRFWRKDGSEAEYIFNVHAIDINRVRKEITEVLGEASSATVSIVGDKIIINSSTASADEAARIAEIAKRYPQVVNLISKTGMERMVYIDVKIVEFKKNAFKNLGVKWSSSGAGPTFGILGDFKKSDVLKGSGGNTQTVNNVTIGSRISPFATYLGVATSFASILNLAQTNGDATILAEPKLTSKSGGQAKFLAGGEVPIPIVSALGQTSVLFKPYGVRLDITPVVGGSGIIATKVTAELSAVDVGNAVNGIPAFFIRRAETEVNLRENETLVLSGMVNEDMAKSIDKVPFLGDVPILGALFKSTEYRRNQTELVIFLTPRFIAAGSEFNTQSTDAALSRVKERRLELAE